MLDNIKFTFFSPLDNIRQGWESFFHFIVYPLLNHQLKTGKAYERQLLYVCVCVCTTMSVTEKNKKKCRKKNDEK